jgi:hypothetical protein
MDWVTVATQRLFQQVQSLLEQRVVDLMEVLHINQHWTPEVLNMLVEQVHHFLEITETTDLVAVVQVRVILGRALRRLYLMTVEHLSPHLVIRSEDLWEQTEQHQLVEVEETVHIMMQEQMPDSFQPRTVLNQLVAAAADILEKQAIPS